MKYDSCFYEPCPEKCQAGAAAGRCEAGCEKYSGNLQCCVPKCEVDCAEAALWGECPAKCKGKVTKTSSVQILSIKDSLETRTAAPQPALLNVPTGIIFSSNINFSETNENILTIRGVEFSLLGKQRWHFVIWIKTWDEGDYLSKNILQEEKGVQCWRGVGVWWNSWMLSRTLRSCLRCRSLSGQRKVILYLSYIMLSTGRLSKAKVFIK